jgi:hypothetical protein
LTALRASGIFKKINIHERPRQIVENTALHSGPTHFGAIGATDPDELSKKVIVNGRTQQTTENTPPHPEPTPFVAQSTLNAEA